MQQLFAEDFAHAGRPIAGPSRKPVRAAKPERLPPYKPHPRGQLVLDLPGVPVDENDIRVGYAVAFRREPARGRFEVLDVGPNLVTIRGATGRPVEVMRRKLRAI